MERAEIEKLSAAERYELATGRKPPEITPERRAQFVEERRKVEAEARRFYGEDPAA